VTATLGPQELWKTCRDLIVWLGNTIGVMICSHLWGLRAGQEVAPSAFRSHWWVTPAKAPFQLEGKLSFPQAILRSPL
jgi:hypothetical protein